MIYSNKSFGSPISFIIRCFSYTVCLLVTFFMSSCGLVSDADKKIYWNNMRQTNELEYQYRALASEIHSIKPCYLIHPESGSKGAFNSVGSQVSLTRSACYLAVAGASGNEYICDKVVSVSTIFLSGADFNEESCRRVAKSKSMTSYNLNVPEIVSLAGYSEAEIDTYLIDKGRFSNFETAKHFRENNPSTYWGEVTRNLLNSEEFFEQISNLPGFGTSADKAEMNKIQWEPRQQRPWIPPEQREQSVPEVNLQAQEQL